MKKSLKKIMAMSPVRQLGPIEYAKPLSLMRSLHSFLKEHGVTEEEYLCSPYLQIEREATAAVALAIGVQKLSGFLTGIRVSAEGAPDFELAAKTDRVDRPYDYSKVENVSVHPQQIKSGVSGTDAIVEEIRKKNKKYGNSAAGWILAVYYRGGVKILPDQIHVRIAEMNPFFSQIWIMGTPSTWNEGHVMIEVYPGKTEVEITPKDWLLELGNDESTIV